MKRAKITPPDEPPGRHWYGIPGTREGLVWRRAHQIKRMLDPTSVTGIRLFKHFYPLITGESATARKA